MTATIAGWFIEWLRRVQGTVTDVEESTEATLDEVLVELRGLRAQLEARNPAGTVVQR